MTKITYELRSTISNKVLQTFGESELRRAMDMAEARNSNPVQTPVKLIKLVTIVEEQELMAA